MAQRFSDTDEAIDGANLGQHMGRIRPLFAASFEPTALLEEREHGRQKVFFDMASDQAGAKLTQDRGVKAGVREI
jgi:hypothetical protein